MTRVAKPTLVSVIDGGKVIGFLLNRGIAGTEAWTAGEQSLGVHADSTLAHAAIVAAQGSTA
jgi:hypothetical protein